MKHSLFKTLLSGLLLSASLFASEMGPLKLKLEFPVAFSKPGEVAKVTVEIPEGWHLTSHIPEDEAFIPLESSLKTTGIEFDSLAYPEPTLKSLEELEMNISYFEKSLELPFTFKSQTGPIDLSQTLFRLYYQACTDILCDPPEETYWKLGEKGVLVPAEKPAASPSASLAAEENSNPMIPERASSPLSAELENPLLLMLLFALLGGLILNIMPCVLPVLSLKVFSLVKQAQESKARLIALGGAFTAGVLISFWILALFVIILKHGGEHAGWGFQMQNPGFLIFLSIVLTLFALNLFGLFEISLGSGTNTKMDKASSRAGLLGALLNGGFMTLLSTPCSAPMLGSSMGWALSQPDGVIFLFYTIVGLGLALPYMLLSLFPAALRWLPKPGNWMVRMKEFMGFLLLLVQVWILSVLVAFSESLATWTLAFLVMLGLSAWIYKSALPFGGLTSSRRRKIVVSVSLLILVVASYLWMVRPALIELKQAPKGEASSYSEENFTPEKVAELNAQGKNVFVDFTADWCITCKVNEKAVLSQDTIQHWFKSGDPIFLIADYTKKDPIIGAELKRFGRAGVPLYVHYSPDHEPHVFPEIITPDMLLKVFTARKR